MTRTPRPGRLAALLPGLLVLTAICTAGGTVSSSDTAPVVELHVKGAPATR